MAAGLVVRLAEPREYDAVGELTVAAYRGDGFLSGDIDYVGSLRDAASRAKHADLLVALRQILTRSTEPAGTVTFCQPGSRYAELSVDGEAEFRMLAVDSRYRGRGVGEALVRACADRARDDGCRRLVCCSRPTCTPRTGSTSGSASSALPSWTGSRLRPPRLHPGALNSVEESLSIHHHAGHPPRRDQPVRRIDGGYLELQQPAIDRHELRGDSDGVTHGYAALMVDDDPGADAGRQRRDAQ